MASQRLCGVSHPEGSRLSSQLDIIIYDALRSGPIVSLETCDVFPWSRLRIRRSEGYIKILIR